MPYGEKFTHALQGIAHGWNPKKGSLRHISQGKAREMLRESTRKAKKKHEGQMRALREA